MFILADPEKAYDLSFYPNQGVGLMRMEFVINSTIRIHPMALVHFDSLTDLAVKKQIGSETWQQYCRNGRIDTTRLVASR